MSILPIQQDKNNNNLSQDKHSISVPDTNLSILEKKEVSVHEGRRQSDLQVLLTKTDDAFEIWTWNIYGQTIQGATELRRALFQNVCSLDAPPIICIQEPHLVSENVVNSYPLDISGTKFKYVGGLAVGIYWDETAVFCMDTESWFMEDRCLMMKFGRVIPSNLANTKIYHYYFYVATYHAPKKGLKKAEINRNTKKLMEELVQFASEEDTEGHKNLPIIFCGDFNTDISRTKIPPLWHLSTCETQKGQNLDWFLLFPQEQTISLNNCQEIDAYSKKSLNSLFFTNETLESLITTVEKLNLEESDFWKVSNHLPISAKISYKIK